MGIRTSWLPRLRWCAAAVVAAGVTFASAGPQAEEPKKPDKIVVNDSGGAMATWMRKAYYDAFEKRYGIHVVETSPDDFGKLRAMVESGNVEWTVTEIGGQDAVRAEKMGLVEKIDDSIVDRSKFPAPTRTPYVFAASVYSTVLGYRKDVFKNGHPTTWAEFWDVKRFPGPRSMRNHPVDNLEFALLADGVPPDKLYPIDMDRAFKKLDEIKPYVTVWWTTGAQPAQLLLDKEVVLATGWNGRFFDLVLHDAPIGIEWGQGALKQGSFVIPKGAKDAYWGQKFLALMTEPKLEAIYANALGYPGLNPDSLQYVDAKVRPYLPTDPDNLKRQFWISNQWWAENGTKAIERWNQWMLKK
ncbi:MAG TPA: ABC transporter substrate-binding protein [Alphaproteobacteria bacterium]|nr:ABC transporter substrate-binding protein [Alphaproteobacteria bacterium]